jgi:hypothetical protein
MNSEKTEPNSELLELYFKQNKLKNSNNTNNNINNNFNTNSSKTTSTNFVNSSNYDLPEGYYKLIDDDPNNQQIVLDDLSNYNEDTNASDYYPKHATNMKKKLDKSLVLSNKNLKLNNSASTTNFNELANSVDTRKPIKFDVNTQNDYDKLPLIDSMLHKSNRDHMRSDSSDSQDSNSKKKIVKWNLW